MATIRDIQMDLRSLADRRNIERSALAAFAEHVPRIFERGEAANGSKIGGYSTVPLYVNPKNAPRKFATKGKTGKSKFADGKPHVSNYFPNGYKQYRQVLGRESGFVNLDLSSDMRKAYIAGPHALGAAFGFINQAESDKADGNEKRFKKVIFDVSDDELDTFIETLIGTL